MKLPRSLRVLWEPATVFAETIAARKGFGTLFLLLGIELFLIRPLRVTSHAMRASFSPSVALMGMWQEYVNYALPVGVGVFVLGIVLYYALRRSGQRRLDPWTAASVLAYAWVPHVLLIAAAVLLARFGVEHPILPGGSFNDPRLSGATLLGKGVIELGPSVLLGMIAVRTCFAASLPTAAKSTRLPLPITAASLLLLIAAFASSSVRIADNWDRARPLLPGDTVPPLDLTSIDGNPLRPDDLYHQVSLIEFWATWCTVCVASMPQVEKLHHKPGDRFRVVSINANEDPGDVKKFVEDHRLSFPVYIDRGRLQSLFRVDSFPTAYLVDGHGTVREVYIGALSAAKIEEDIDQVLAEPDRH
ncbi:MAG: hypothetical protein A2289_25190 [Deltaproteobacteria bacterium RIFOXYA12_FULL_58_15]|nr:MAG: hypothetical protein A2289_25190 [Deltaproteobacteria bacterium RIFOXYA12_FULL_58_15]